MYVGDTLGMEFLFYKIIKKCCKIDSEICNYLSVIEDFIVDENDLKRIQDWHVDKVICACQFHKIILKD